jgi:imidazolonepropionase-like amidohydrolase
MGQLDDGADLLKLYLDGPDPEVCPWSVDEVRGVVEAAHARGAKVTAHSGRLDGARVGAEAGVDSLEHGFELDADVAAMMAANGVALVTTRGNALVADVPAHHHAASIRRGGRCRADA